MSQNRINFRQRPHELVKALNENFAFFTASVTGSPNFMRVRSEIWILWEHVLEWTKHVQNPGFWTIGNKIDLPHVCFMYCTSSNSWAIPKPFRRRVLVFLSYVITTRNLNLPKTASKYSSPKSEQTVKGKTQRQGKSILFRISIKGTI